MHVVVPAQQLPPLVGIIRLRSVGEAREGYGRGPGADRAVRIVERVHLVTVQAEY
jgi:hypothetical protein